MLCLEGMVEHGLFFNVSNKCVLVEETVLISKRALSALKGSEHVIVWDVDVHLRVCGPCDKGGVMEGVLLWMRFWVGLAAAILHTSVRT